MQAGTFISVSIRSLFPAPRYHAPALAAARLGLILAPGCPGGALAQGRVDAQYEVSLAGIPIGKGAWVVEIADDQYSASASGRTTGLIAMLGSGDGSGGAVGRIVKGQF